jgi:hypothetical protein
MAIRIFKMNKIKTFWIIVLIILGLGNFYFFKYNQPIKEEFDIINKIKNQLRRGTMQKIEKIQVKTDSFINKAQNQAIKPFL